MAKMQQGKEPMLTRGKILLLSVILVVITLALTEFTSYLIFRFVGWKKYNYEVVESPYHPYLGWTHAKNTLLRSANACGPAGAYIQTDDEGYAITPRLSYENPELKIAITGGSTIFGVGSSGNASTVPARLEEIIYNEMNLKVEVYNLAGRGYQSFQEMLTLHTFLMTHKVDLVLAISGRNDSLYAASDQNISSVFFPSHVYATAEFVRKAENGELIYLKGLRNKFRSSCYTCELFYRALKRLFYTPSVNENVEDIDNMAVGTFQNIFERVNITKSHYALMGVISKENDAIFVMFLQPTAYTKNKLSSKETSCISYKAERSEYLSKYEEKFYDRLRLSKKNFLYYDSANVLDNVEVDTYIDQCHYNDNGAKAVAEAIFLKIKPIITDILHRKSYAPPSNTDEFNLPIAQ